MYKIYLICRINKKYPYHIHTPTLLTKKYKKKHSTKIKKEKQNKRCEKKCRWWWWWWWWGVGRDEVGNSYDICLKDVPWILP